MSSQVPTIENWNRCRGNTIDCQSYSILDRTWALYAVCTIFAWQDYEQPLHRLYYIFMFVLVLDQIFVVVEEFVKQIWVFGFCFLLRNGCWQRMGTCFKQNCSFHIWNFFYDSQFISFRYIFCMFAICSNVNYKYNVNIFDLHTLKV